MNYQNFNQHAWASFKIFTIPRFGFIISVVYTVVLILLILRIIFGGFYIQNQAFKQFCDGGLHKWLVGDKVKEKVETMEEKSINIFIIDVFLHNMIFIFIAIILRYLVLSPDIISTIINDIMGFYENITKK